MKHNVTFSGDAREGSSLTIRLTCECGYTAIWDGTERYANPKTIIEGHLQLVAFEEEEREKQRPLEQIRGRIAEAYRLAYRPAHRPDAAEDTRVLERAAWIAGANHGTSQGHEVNEDDLALDCPYNTEEETAALRTSVYGDDS